MTRIFSRVPAPSVGVCSIVPGRPRPGKASLTSLSSYLGNITFAKFVKFRNKLYASTCNILNRNVLFQRQKYLNTNYPRLCIDGEAEC